jgi:hypothetical protein
MFASCIRNGRNNKLLHYAPSLLRLSAPLGERLSSGLIDRRAWLSLDAWRPIFPTSVRLCVSFGKKEVFHVRGARTGDPRRLAHNLAMNSFDASCRNPGQGQLRQKLI